MSSTSPPSALVQARSLISSCCLISCSGCSSEPGARSSSDRSRSWSFSSKSWRHRVAKKKSPRTCRSRWRRRKNRSSLPVEPCRNICRVRLAPGNGRTKTGRLWTYVRDGRPCADPVPPAVWFAFSPDRRGEHPQAHLKTFQGTLQADAYAGFHPLYEGDRIVEAACWAHTRRKFHDILAATESPPAVEAVRRIGELYAVEKQARGSPPEIRLQARQARARPIMEDLRRGLDRTLQDLSAKSDMAGAIRYALTRWTALTRYLDDGTIEIDNNAAERALRVVALGRKNYLFAGSNRGGERAAAIYSLLGTAKLNGTNPERYLRYVLTHIADHPINCIAELLPWNIPAAHSTDLTTDT